MIEPPGEPSPPRKVWPFIVIPVVVLLTGSVLGIVLLTGGDDDQAGPGPSTSQTTEDVSEPELTRLNPALPPTVRYEVRGSGGGYVVYRDESGYIADEEVQLPWSLTIEGDVDPALIGSPAGGPGEVSCKLTVNGRTIFEDYSGSKGYADCMPLPAHP